jgi:hypothetical protein
MGGNGDQMMLNAKTLALSRQPPSRLTVRPRIPPWTYFLPSCLKQTKFEEAIPTSDQQASCSLDRVELSRGPPADVSHRSGENGWTRVCWRRFARARTRPEATCASCGFDVPSGDGGDGLGRSEMKCDMTKRHQRETTTCRSGHEVVTRRPPRMQRSSSCADIERHLQTSQKHLNTVMSTVR